jgi:hypothetical protein
MLLAAGAHAAPVAPAAPTVVGAPRLRGAAPHAAVVTMPSKTALRPAAPVASPRRLSHPRESARPVAPSPEAFAALEARVAGVTDAATASELGHALAAELRVFAPSYIALQKTNAAAAKANFGPSWEAASKVIAAALAHKDPSMSAALIVPVARVLDESGSTAAAPCLFKLIAGNEAAPAVERAHAHVRLGERALADVQTWQNERLSPFQQAVLHLGGKPSWAEKLGAAAAHLQAAAQLEPEPIPKNELKQRGSSLKQRVRAARATGVARVDTSALSSRERRLLQALAEVKRRGYALDIARDDELGSSHFVTPGLDRRIEVRFGVLDYEGVVETADDVLRHELQHFYDWAQGKEVALARDDSKTAVLHTLRSEVRANFAASNDSGKALSHTRVLYAETAETLDSLHAEVQAERAASGRAGPVDRAVFSRLMRRWRELRVHADPGPEGGPVRANAAPLGVLPDVRQRAVAGGAPR